MFRSISNHPVVVGVDFTDSPSLTQQEWKEQQSIDAMIRRCMMGDTSVWRRPQFVNVLSAPESYHDAQNKLALARSAWNDLPETVRATYGSPEALLSELDRLQSAAKANEADSNGVVSSEKPETTTSVNTTVTPTEQK